MTFSTYLRLLRDHHSSLFTNVFLVATETQLQSGLVRTAHPTVTEYLIVTARSMCAMRSMSGLSIGGNQKYF